jgi:hypothetical protein
VAVFDYFRDIRGQFRGQFKEKTMTEDELIFMGAAVLLAPMTKQERLDPENDSDIGVAVAYAHFLHQEVKKLAEMKSKLKGQQFAETMRKLAQGRK